MRQAETTFLGRRLHNQRLTRSELRPSTELRAGRPADVVAWLGAVQAQDYPAAKWALGLRAPGLTDDDVEQAFTEGRILRTHVLRPTWHFVTPADIRWMLALTGPRVNNCNIRNFRRLGLTDAVLKRVRVVFERALRGGRHLTRADLAAALRTAGIQVEGQALAHVMMNAELEGVVCSGARQGKQPTYALLEERVPRGRIITRDEALGELTRRYFSSHGPATLGDFVWWSGLIVADARRGIEIAGAALERRAIAAGAYWSAAAGPGPRASRAATAHLLPNYDEYLVAYRERGGGDIFAHSLVIDGRVAGTWTKAPRQGAVTVNVASTRRLTPAERRAVAAAAERYGRFLQQPVICVQR